MIPQLIAQHGRWQPEKAALVEGDRSFNWAQFDAATNRVANGLAQLGLTHGQRLAVLMSNSIEMALLLFGAGKAGISVVPLNVAVSDAAVAAMIGDSNAAAIAASDAYCTRIDRLIKAGQLPATLHRLAVAAPGENWCDLPTWLSQQSAAAPAAQVSPDTECNIIYSSGTTGQPKGIVHDHRCRLQWANDMSIALRYHSGCTTVCSLGLFSNISWVAMLATLLVGGALVIMPSFSPALLAATVRRLRVTHGAFVPVQLARIVEAADFCAADYSSLQTIMSCGSPLAPALKRAVRDRLGCEVIELYGLTEGLVTTLAPEDMDAKIESVGRPLPGQRLAIIDANDCEVAPGEPGEIVGAGGKIATLVDLSDVSMTVFLPETIAGRIAIGSEARLVLDAAPQYVIPARVSFVASQAQFTPKSVETASERQKLVFQVKLQLDPQLLKPYEAKVKSGLPGVATVRLDPTVPWPARLEVKLPPVPTAETALAIPAP